MDSRILTLDAERWEAPGSDTAWIAAVEEGKVLFFPRLGFPLTPAEQGLLKPELLEAGTRNISWSPDRGLKGVAGGPAVQAAVGLVLQRFSAQARALVTGLFPAYAPHLRAAPASLRPVSVSQRRQSVRADDRRLHVDAFPSRPNRGERILRVFTNINPAGEPRVWRVGEPLEDAARRFLPRAKAYSAWQARALAALRVTKSLRSEYDHLMLQLHDLMKADERWQRESPQLTFPFPAGSSWVCFSDHTLHAVMAGQHMLEQTFHLPVDRQYNPSKSPLALLGRLAGHPVA